jgi:hypothetical protein
MSEIVDYKKEEIEAKFGIFAEEEREAERDY